MRVILKHGGNTVALPDAAAVELIRQCNASRLRDDVEPQAIIAAMLARSARRADSESLPVEQQPAVQAGPLTPAETVPHGTDAQ